MSVRRLIGSDPASQILFDLLLKLLKVLKEILDVFNVLATGLNTHAITLFSQIASIHFEPRVE